jgi:fatty acid desaturase
MLRHRADVRTLTFVAFYYLLLAAEWNLAPMHAVVVLPLVLLTCVVAWICAVITHNTLHTPVFHNRAANRLFQVALTCAYGFPVSEYVPGHNLSHHKFTQKRADLMRTSKVRFGWNVLNLLAFFPRVGADIFRENYRYVSMMKQRMPRWYHQLVIEMVMCWGAKGVLLLIDWKKGLLFVIIPHFFAVNGITTVNYLQHDGCDEDHPFNHSRNFVGRIFNWFTFNNGFHGIHHEHPGLHWSLLREAHNSELHEGISPVLEQPSLAVYMFRAFVYPGKRLRYDGEPVRLPLEGPDEEWIPKNIQSAVHELGAEGTALDAG